MGADCYTCNTDDYIIPCNTTHDRNCGIPMNYIDIFLEALSAEKGRSEKTLTSYASDLNLANAAIDGGLMNATESAVQQYLSSLPDKPSSVARKASALRGFYKFLMLEKIITVNPTANLELPKRNRALPKFLTVEEIEFLAKNNVCDVKR